MVTIASPVVIALLALLGPGIAFLLSVRGREPHSIVLASLPWALMLASGGVALGTWETLAGFERLASGDGSSQRLAVLLTRGVEDLRAGTAGTGLCMVVAVLLQFVAQPIRATDAAVQRPTMGAKAGSMRSVGTVVLLAASLFLVPVALLHVSLHAALDQVIGIAAQLTKVSAPQAHVRPMATGGSLGALGERLTVIGLAAEGLGWLLFALAVCLVCVRSGSRAWSLRLYSQLLAGALCLTALSALIDLTSDRAWLRRTFESRTLSQSTGLLAPPSGGQARYTNAKALSDPCASPIAFGMAPPNRS